MDAEAFISGSEIALEQLMLEMTPPLMKYCYNILLNYSDAEDAVQDTFIKIYRSRASIRNSGTLTAYLYRIAYTSSIDIIRKRRFLLKAKKIQHNESKHISEEMNVALKKLQPIDRALIYSRIVDEVGYSELSEIFGKSEQSLRKRYERAKKKLAVLLRPDGTQNLYEFNKGVD